MIIVASVGGEWVIPHFIVMIPILRFSISKSAEAFEQNGFDSKILR